MKPSGIQARSSVEVDAPRDSASQMARATLGLREMLLLGAFRPGQRIAEIPLSAKLGVSRTPLRLAFEKLEHEGLVYALPHSGFAASEFKLSDIWDAIETPGSPGRSRCPARSGTSEGPRSGRTPASDQSRHGRN